uniref:DM2 domain-containing protein n=1 Tax=viral metagenome TaxID=1070528 RepID=A0A6C0I6Q9_9ZZZZ
MPKQVKKNSTEVAETTTAPVATNTAAAVEAKAPKPKAVKKVAETKPVEVKVEAPATPIETAPAATVDEVEAAITTKSAEFSAKLNQLSTLIASLKSEYKTMEKQWSKELKAANKVSSKNKKKSGNRAPSGFVKPTRISDELAKFLEKPAGTEMARTDVTRQLNTYIRANSLQDKENGRKINPDSKLQALLKLKKTDELTYFNLQRYMSPHFTKNTPAVVAAVATA